MGFACKMLGTSIYFPDFLELIVFFIQQPVHSSSFVARNYPNKVSTSEYRISLQSVQKVCLKGEDVRKVSPEGLQTKHFWKSIQPIFFCATCQ